MVLVWHLLHFGTYRTSSKILKNQSEGKLISLGHDFLQLLGTIKQKILFL